MSEIAAVVLMPRDDLIQGSAAQMGANGCRPDIYIR